MRAAVLNHQPGALEIEDLHVADPGPGEVLVRTVGAGLCHSDLHFMEGLFPLRVPAVLGHESAGVVEAVGDGVSYVQPGDHVVCCLSIFCGQCRQCLSGAPARCANASAGSRPRGAPPQATSRGKRAPLASVACARGKLARTRSCRQRSVKRAG